MKPLPVVLAASLVANVGLLTFAICEPTPAHPGDTLQAAPVVPKTDDAKRDQTEIETDLVTALKTNDAEGLRNLLREAGVPEDDLRILVAAFVVARYRERMTALRPKPAAGGAWWKSELNDWNEGTTREQRREARRLHRELRQEITRLIGPDDGLLGDDWSDPRLAFLSEAKREQLQEIELDYQELLQEAQEDMQGFNLPSDVERMRFLREEKMRDLAAVLTTDELAEYELRVSPIAERLRWKTGLFDATEEEYRTLFALHKAAGEGQVTDAWGNLIELESDNHFEKERLLAAQLEKAIGPERYADYLRSQNHEYRQLVAATQRLDLPPDTPKRVHSLRTEVSAESHRIAADAALTDDQKRQAFAALAQATRDQVRAALGDEAAGVYLANAMSWINQVEQGNVVTFSGENSWSHTPFPASE